MDKVTKGLTCADVVLGKLNRVAEVQKRAMDAAQGRIVGATALNMLAYHDMYRQLKAEYALTLEKMDSVRDVREGIAQNGYVWEYRRILKCEERYADLWLRIQANNEQGGT